MIDLMDWDLLRVDAVLSARESAVSRLVRDLGHLVEADDLFQESSIIIASHPEKVRAYLADAENPGHLTRWIWSRLRDKIRPELRRANQTVSLTRVEATHQ
ncbi:hypothetical protein [Saccharothrix sp. HUAS TT1]|uniref:hypothetical protein n=1 Tax=unclassified Saccharothrix TaxID=2593673 RepID=UPI00345B5F08